MKSSASSSRLLPVSIRTPAIAILGLLGAMVPGWVVPAPVLAQDRQFPVAIENIRVGLDGIYKIGAWTPVWVDLTSRVGRFSGTLDLEVPDEDGVPTHFRLPVTVDEARGLATFVGYVRPGTRMSEITVRVFGEGDRRASRTVRPEDLPGGRSPVSLDPSQVFLVTLGQARGVAEIAGLSSFAGSGTSGAISNTELAVAAPAIPAGLPGRWYGFDSADAIVLDTNDAAVMDDLQNRGEPLRQWVRNGGHLIVAVAANWQAARERLGDMLPAVPVGTTRLNDSGEIEAFAGSSTNQLLPLGGSMLVADLQGLEERGALALAATAETPLIVRGAYGFGRVTLVGLDVDQPPFANWADRALFWVRALDLHATGDATSATQAGSGGAFFQQSISDLSSVLYRAMDRPPGVSLVPFGWVAFFVFLYILLIGPGDYFFLKKILKRMELTWITFPIIVIVVSGLAYLAAYRLKGTELKIVKLDIVDVDQASGLVRGSSWMTLFSPQNRDYGLTVEPLPTTSAPTGDATVEFSRDRLLTGPPPGSERLVSWFGPADPRFGGGTGGLSLSGGGYGYGPPGELDALLGVRIPVWSTKSFAARWTTLLGGDPILEVDLDVIGTDRLSGTITNASDRPLEDAVLFFGSVVYDQLGTIAPGASVRIDVASRLRPLSGYLEERAKRFVDAATGVVNAPSDAPGTVALADIGRVAMFRGGMAAKTAAPPATAMRGLDLSGQLPFGRPMLVARVSDPLARLALDGAPSPPSVDQTSLIRVILPRIDRGGSTAGTNRTGSATASRDDVSQGA